MTASPQDFPGLTNQPQIMMSPTLGGPQTQGVVVQKPKSDVYTVMLVIAFLALVLGIVCLVLEMESYDWDYKGPPKGVSPGAASWLAPSDDAPAMNSAIAQAVSPEPSLAPHSMPPRADLFLSAVG